MLEIGKVLLVLSLAIWLLTSVAVEGSDSRRQGDLQITCSDSVSVRTDGARLTCKLENQCGEGIMILLSDATLDGPIGASDYIGRLAGGQRYENVLQYGVGPEEAFDAGSLSHPWVDLTDEDLDRLYRLAPATSMSIAVQLNVKEMGLSSLLGVLVRLKLVYAVEARLRSLKPTLESPKSCWKSLENSLNSQELLKSNRVGTRRLVPGLRMLTDGCHDTISRQFQHAYSNTIILR